MVSSQDYILYEEKIPHGLKLSTIDFGTVSIRMIDSDDYWDDDSEWEEYYDIGSQYFQEIINRLKNIYIPRDKNMLDVHLKKTYDNIMNDNGKILFLYILTIVEAKKIENKEIRCKELIPILCGENIKYSKNIWSKGP